MAAVTRCDKCGKILNNEDSYNINIARCNKLGHRSGYVGSLDVCEDCLEKIMEEASDVKSGDIETTN